MISFPAACVLLPPTAFRNPWLVFVSFDRFSSFIISKILCKWQEEPPMATELKRTGSSLDRIEELLGADARNLLDYKSQTIARDDLHLPGPDFIDRVWALSDRNSSVLRSL